MRESNFAFPAQNKACVCITSQLYDRRALDTTSALPLFNSLTHLTYLTSTSPRIREIMTMDGGLERLVRILHEFCMCPPPPENPALLYGLTPPNARPPKLAPCLNPTSFDKHAAYRFSLAFQCIVNIGVRGSEPIRSRVVQAGTLDVVGCILEAWLANKGFAVGPSAASGVGGSGGSNGAGGVPRETREQRHQRRLEQRQKEDVMQIQRALQRHFQADTSGASSSSSSSAALQRRNRHNNQDQDDSMESAPASSSQLLLLSTNSSAYPSAATSASNSDTEVSTDNSIAATPQGSGTPTGSMIIPSRDRSGTIIARTVWDQRPQANPTPLHHHHHQQHNNAPAGLNAVAGPLSIPPRGRRIRHRELPPDSPSATSTASSSSNSRAETETEDDIDMDRDISMMSIDADQDTENENDQGRIDSDVGSVSASASPSPERVPPTARERRLTMTMGRRGTVVGIISDEPAPNVVQQVGALGLNDTDAHIIINDNVTLNDGVGVNVGDPGVTVGVEDGIVSLDQNDDFAMGAPPGAPGAIGEAPTPRGLNLNMLGLVGPEERRRRNTTAPLVPPPSTATNDTQSLPPDVTPRAAVVALPGVGSHTLRGQTSTSTITQHAIHHPTHHPTPNQAHYQPTQVSAASQERGHQRNATIRARNFVVPPVDAAGPSNGVVMPTTAAPVPGATTVRPPGNPTAAQTAAATLSMSRDTATVVESSSSSSSSGPYRDEDVLLSLQLLAYLSKYPHVRQAFYKPRNTFHPESAEFGGPRFGSSYAAQTEREKRRERDRKDKDGAKLGVSASTPMGSRSGKEKAPPAIAASTSTTPQPSIANAPSTAPNGAPSSARQTNVFSLVERFTYKPSSSDHHDGPPRLPPEIQYWAGVIMRNACRKDDARGGIRQCANMMCGKWETYPREFAKCRRCRKAKYCGKECQSTAWSEGHRFWCSAKDVDEEVSNRHANTSASNSAAADATRGGESTQQTILISDNGSGQMEVPISTRERRYRPPRDHHHHQQAQAAASSSSSASTMARTSSVASSKTVVPSTSTAASTSGSASGSGSSAVALSISRDKTIQPASSSNATADSSASGSTSTTSTFSATFASRSRLLFGLRPPIATSTAATTTAVSNVGAGSSVSHPQELQIPPYRARNVVASRPRAAGSEISYGASGRRRAETITTASRSTQGEAISPTSVLSPGGAGYSFPSTSRTTNGNADNAVPPNVIIGPMPPPSPSSTQAESVVRSSWWRLTPDDPPPHMQLQMSYSRTVTQGRIGPTTSVAGSVLESASAGRPPVSPTNVGSPSSEDWVMSSPPSTARRVRGAVLQERRRQHAEDNDEMMLG